MLAQLQRHRLVVLRSSDLFSSMLLILRVGVLLAQMEALPVVQPFDFDAGQLQVGIF